MPIVGVLRHPVTFSRLSHAWYEVTLTGAMYRMEGSYLEPTRQFHATTQLSRSNVLGPGHSVANKAVFDTKKIQRTMNKVMGVRTPVNKVAYKPSLIKKTYGATVAKQEFQLKQGASMDEKGSEHESTKEGPTQGNVRRARQLSDIMFLRISEMIHIGCLHPVFQKHNIEITKVKMLPDMRNLHVSWATTGNPLVDTEIGQTLRNEAAWLIRQQIAELKIIGRAPTVTFFADESRVRLNHVAHLIEVSDKPPEEALDPLVEEPKRGLKPFSSSVQEKDIGVDLSKRISAFSFPPDAPTWREMNSGVIVIRDSRNLNHDFIMGQALRAKVSANPALSQQWDESERNDFEMKYGSYLDSKYSWRFNARDKDELTSYLKERKLKIRDKKIKRSDDGYGSIDSDDDDDDYRDDDDYHNHESIS